MDVRLDYGRTGLTVRLPDGPRISVLEASQGVPLPNPAAALAEALAQPIGAAPLIQLARGRRNAVLVIADKTRPVPYGVVLPPILAALDAAGIGPEQIEILVATGLHRANTEAELTEMCGRDVVGHYRIRNHVARRAEEHVHLGRTSRGTEVWLDRGFVEADLKIVAGLIEPHLMAGYSGGRKAVAPGLAAVATMRSLHGVAMLEENIGPGILDGNPFHSDLLEIARMTRVDFMVDVSIDRQRRLSGVFAGDIEQAHLAGAHFVERHVRVDLEDEADIVVTSAGGYPLDDTYYQSIKGLTAALNIVRRGGTIILAAAATEGIGSTEFQELLKTVRGNDDFMARAQTPGFFHIDQWMVQHLCQVLRKANVMLVTEGLEPGVVRGLLAEPAASVEEALARCLDRSANRAHIAVLPEGPYTLATVRGRKLALGRAWMGEAA